MIGEIPKENSRKRLWYEDKCEISSPGSMGSLVTIIYDLVLRDRLTS